jgi:DNA-binding LytR/AlgR family response regulator
MNVLIIEDEFHAARILTETLSKVRPGSRVLSVIDSVKSSLNWLYRNELELDLIFMDIELADGNSFEIFKHARMPAPVIFTTAYNQYAVDAFKVNAIDYLLKPISKEDLEQSILRWEKQGGQSVLFLESQMEEISSLFQSKQKKNRCLVKKGEVFEFINVSDIAMAYSEDSVTFLVTFDGKRHLYGRTVEQLLGELDERCFFQLNRGQLVNVENVIQVHPYLGQRLKLKVRMDGGQDDVLVSRQRASDFKRWLDS